MTNPILVTGIHRSGSTFVGRMLSINSEVAYIQEPFNKAYGLGVFDTDYKYLTDETIDPEIRQALDDLINLNQANFQIPSLLNRHENVANRWKLVKEWSRAKGEADLSQFIKRLFFKSKAQLGFELAKRTPSVQRLLLKDPLAALSSEYLHQRYNMQVVVLIRHPLSFAGSVKRLNWNFDFNALLQQPGLMDEHLAPYREEMLTLRGQNGSIIENAALVWNCIYSVLQTYITRNSTFITVRHEDIAREPLEQFDRLYCALNLEFSPEVKKKIRDYTSAQNPAEPKNNATHQLNRDSRSLIYAWKEILTDEEIRHVKEKTRSVAAHFYDETIFQDA